MTTAIQAACALAGSGALSPSLTTQIDAATALAGSGLVAAALTTQITVATALSASGVILPALTTQITLATTLSGAGTITAAMTVPLGGSHGRRDGPGAGRCGHHSGERRHRRDPGPIRSDQCANQLTNPR